MIFFIFSLVICALSVTTFFFMDFLGYVDRKMAWGDLKGWQKCCFIGVFQFPALMFLMFLFFLLISQ